VSSDRVKDFLTSRMLLAIIIGTILVMLDMKFGIMSLFMFGVSSILVVAFIVGIIAGGVKDGILSELGVIVLSILLMTLLMPFAYPEWAEVLLYPDAFIPLSMVFLAMYMLDHSYTLGVLGVFWYDALGSPEYNPHLFTMLIVAPFTYGLALVLGGLGGFVGKRLWPKVSPGPKTEQPTPEPQPEEPTNQ